MAQTKTESRALNQQETELLADLLTDYQRKMGQRAHESLTEVERRACLDVAEQAAKLRDLLYANQEAEDQYAKDQTSNLMVTAMNQGSYDRINGRALHPEVYAQDATLRAAYEIGYNNAKEAEDNEVRIAERKAWDPNP